MLVPISFFSSINLCKSPTPLFFILLFPSLLLAFFFPSHLPFVSFSFLSLPLFLTTSFPLHLFPGGQINIGVTLVPSSFKRPSIRNSPRLCVVQVVATPHSADWFTIALWMSLSHLIRMQSLEFHQSLAVNSAVIYSPIYDQGYIKGKETQLMNWYWSWMWNNHWIT